MDGKDPGTHETLSREISRRNATRTIRGGDFSTSLRFGRNDEGAGRRFCHLGSEISPLRYAFVEMTEVQAAFCPGRNEMGLLSFNHQNGAGEYCLLRGLWISLRFFIFQRAGGSGPSAAVS